MVSCNVPTPVESTDTLDTVPTTPRGPRGGRCVPS